MARAFNGNLMIALQTSISTTSLSTTANSTTSSVTASVSGGRDTYTYLWVSSGTSCTITNPTSATTTFTGSSVTGTTNIYCAITDTITGNTLNTDECIITWTTISQNVVISGVVIFTGTTQAYTLTGTPATPAPSGTPPSFINAGTYTYPTNITSITPGIGYNLGSVSGSFVISRRSITAMSFTLNGVAFTTNQSRTAGTNYTIAVSSVTPSGATYSPSSIVRSAAGTYSLTSSGTGNYQGSFTSPTLTLTVAGSIAETSRTTAYSVELTATLSGATATGYSWSRTGGTYAGTVTFSSTTTQVVTATVSSAAGTNNSIIRCIISYSGGTVSPTITVGWGVI